MLIKFIYPRKVELLEKIASKITDAKTKSSLLGFSLYLTGRYNQKQIKINLVPPSKNTPPYLYLFCYVSLPFKLKIFKDGNFFNLLKRLGIYSEIEIGDIIFDQKYFIHTNNEMAARNYLLNSKIKDIMDEIMVLGFNSIEVKKKYIVIKKRNYNLEEDLHETNIMHIFEMLDILSANFNYY